MARHLLSSYLSWVMVRARRHGGPNWRGVGRADITPLRRRRLSLSAAGTGHRALGKVEQPSTARQVGRILVGQPNARSTSLVVK